MSRDRFSPVIAAAPVSERDEKRGDVAPKSLGDRGDGAVVKPTWPLDVSLGSFGDGSRLVEAACFNTVEGEAVGIEAVEGTVEAGERSAWAGATDMGCFSDPMRPSTQ